MFFFIRRLLFGIEADSTIPEQKPSSLTPPNLSFKPCAGDMKVEYDEEAVWMEVSGWWGFHKSSSATTQHATTNVVSGRGAFRAQTDHKPSEGSVGFTFRDPI